MFFSRVELHQLPLTGQGERNMSDKPTNDALEFEKILNALDCGVVKIIFTDKDHRTVQWANDGFFRLTGSTREDYADAERSGNPRNVLHPDDFEWVFKAFADHVETREPLDIAYRVFHKDGHIVWLHVTSSVIGIEDGNPVFINVMTDITEHKNLQLRLQWEQERDRIISSLSNEIIFEYRCDEDVMLHFGRYYEVLGDRAVIKHYHHFLRNEGVIHPDDVHVLESLLDPQELERHSLTGYAADANAEEAALLRLRANDEAETGAATATATKDKDTASAEPKAAVDSELVSREIKEIWHQFHDSMQHNTESNVLLLEKIPRFRLRLLSGEYQWYWAVCTTVVDFTGQNVILGKVVNSHEAMTTIERLKERSETDSLTSLLNRGAGEQAVIQCLNDNSVSWILMVIDIDDFKQVNDTYGHSRGDAAIKSLGDCLRKICRSTDVVARLGGDEFLVLLRGSFSPDSSRKIAYSFWNRLQQKLKEHTAALGFSFTLSAGVAISSQHGVVYAVLFDCADAALYTSKRAGRNRLTVAP